ncbi:MAG: type II/IV secretion system protein [Candidatus Margulisbacteria bacterium]|nr:type II/IV secretion system protein [Candidatus Margulisiibacteriota bacterium]
MSKFESVDLKRFTIDPAILTQLPLELMEKNNVIPFKKEKKQLYVATNTPEDFELQSMIENITGESIKFVYAESSDIKAAILSRLKIKTIFGSLEEPDYAEFKSIHLVSERREINPIVLSNLPDIPNIPDLVDLILFHAISHHASDIHLDPGPESLFIRMRIDGVLHVFQQLPLTFMSPLISTIKVYSGMDIAETRLPQDGQISVTIIEKDDDLDKNPEIDVRVGSVSTIYGEKLTLRILDSNKMDLKLSSLGFSEKQLNTLEEIIKYPQGMLLVTGPTGSGKTTTLFAILNQIKGFATNIVTIEDPVEYRMAWLNQVEVNSSIGLTFASACRSFLRLDPDVILVGEIRDSETAQIAVQNALVGTLLLSTIHSNSAIGTIQRLTSLGLPKFWISSTLTAVLGQRLARKICQKCKTVDKPNPLMLKALGLTKTKKYYKGKGCEQCLNTGYSGRLVISELLTVSDDMRKAIEEDKKEMEITSLAKKNGFKPFIFDAGEKIKAGITSVEEICRVLKIQ